MQSPRGSGGQTSSGEVRGNVSRGSLGSCIAEQALATHGECGGIERPSDRGKTDQVTLLTTVRLPIPWDTFGLASPLQTDTTCLCDGSPGWSWDPAGPDLGIPAVPTTTGETVEGWGLDHVVLLVPDIGAAVDELDPHLGAPRLRTRVGDRQAAFYRVGPLLEMIESPVRAPALYGVALVTTESLEVIALRWRARGLDVTHPRPAIQAGRRILTVRGTDAGLAVMSPDRSVSI
jgi:hypothetical protein